MITVPAFYAVAAFGIILNGISKRGFAGAFAGIAVPLMSIFIAPQRAAAIMLPVLLAMDVFGPAAFYKHIDRKVLLTLLPGGVAGTLLGTFTFGAFDVNVVRVVIGVIAVTFSLMMWMKIGANRPAAEASHGRA